MTNSTDLSARIEKAIQTIKNIDDKVREELNKELEKVDELRKKLQESENRNGK